MDFIAPPGAKNSRASKMEEKIPQWRGVEDACVEDTVKVVMVPTLQYPMPSSCACAAKASSACLLSPLTFSM